MKGKEAAPLTPNGNNAKATPAIVSNLDDDCDVFFKTVPNTPKEPKKVKFNDHTEITEYVKYDYIPCSRQRKKSNNVDKETRTIQQLCDDTQWILQCELGATRGRAMAMLMDSQYECSDVDEVHIVLGPKSDLKVRIKSDEDLEDDPRAELFEDIIPHVPVKFGKKGNVMWYHYANRTPGPTIHRGLRQWS